MKELSDQERVQEHIISGEGILVQSFPAYYELITENYLLRFSSVERGDGNYKFYRSCESWDHPIMHLSETEIPDFIGETLIDLEGK